MMDEVKSNQINTLPKNINDPEKDDTEEQCGKSGERSSKPASSPFPILFSRNKSLHMSHI